MKKILTLFLGWRIYLILAMILGLALPVKLSFLGGEAKNYFQSPLIWSWANFDGVHYLGIASFGYRQFEQAFFPLYPLLMKYISLFTLIDYVRIGQLIANVSFLVGLYVFYKLVRLDRPQKEAYWPLLFLIVFPTSFYFAGVYSESLFLLLSMACFYAARKQKWWLAGILGALASATRFVGVLLLPALAVEYFLSTRADKRSFLWLLLIPLGLVLYMYWLNQNYGDPFYFYHVQSAYGAGRTNSSIILLPQVIFRYLKILVTASFNYQYLISLFEFVTSMGIMGLLIYGINKMRQSYWIFTCLSFIVPTLTGTFLSMPRFAVTMFPLFILLPSILKTARKRMFVLGVFLVILFIATMFFTRGYWVA